MFYNTWPSLNSPHLCFFSPLSSLCPESLSLKMGKLRVHTRGHRAVTALIPSELIVIWFALYLGFAILVLLFLPLHSDHRNIV